MATYTSVTNGNWTNPATWGESTAYPDTEGDIVNIGDTVTYNVDSTVRMGLITISNGGTLTFSRSMSTELCVSAAAADEIHVAAGGTLDVGTVGSPIPEGYHAFISVDYALIGGNTNQTPGVHNSGTFTMVGNGAKMRKINQTNATGRIEEVFDATHAPAIKALKCAAVDGQDLVPITFTLQNVPAKKSRTFFVYVMLSNGWATAPTAGQLYLNANYPSTGGGTANAVSTGTANTFWQVLSVTCTPARKGNITVTLHLTHGETDQYVLVDPVVYLEDPGGADASANPALVMRASSPDLTIVEDQNVAYDGSPGVAVLSDGNILAVTNIGPDAFIAEWDSTGAFVQTFGDGDFTFPMGMCAYSSDTLFVSDRVALVGRILKYVKTGGTWALDPTWGTAGVAEVARPTEQWRNQYLTEPNGADSYPIIVGMAVRPSNGYVYAIDNQLHRVVVLDSSGTEVTTFSHGGTAAGLLNSPTNCIILPTWNSGSGEIHICNGINRRIEVFNFAGTYLRRYGLSRSYIGSFIGPMGIALDPNINAIVVSDPTLGAIQYFDQRGNYIFHVGEDPPVMDDDHVNGIPHQRALLDVIPQYVAWNSTINRLMVATWDGATTYTIEGRAVTYTAP